MGIKYCKECGKPFDIPYNRYCCVGCARTADRRNQRERYRKKFFEKYEDTHKAICPICKKQFGKKKEAQIYCSKSCARVGQNMKYREEKKRERERAELQDKFKPRRILCGECKHFTVDKERKWVAFRNRQGGERVLYVLMGTCGITGDRHDRCSWCELEGVIK